MTVWLRLEEHEARLLINATRNEAHSFSATAQDTQAARCRALADRLERKSLSARPLAYRAALASVEYETEPATCSAPDLDALLNRAHGNVIRPDLSTEVRTARKAEQTKRNNAAISMAIPLRHLHPDDFASLFKQAKERVYAERGPLPGDES